MADQDQDMIARARLHGWHPKEEFKGDPNRWVDAETFVERMETSTPVMRERLQAIEKRAIKAEEATRSMTNEMRIMSENFKAVSASFDEMRTQAATARQQGYAQAERDIKRRIADAARDGDTDAAVRATDELDRLGKKQAEDAAKEAAAKAERDAAAKAATNNGQQQLTPYMEEVKRWRDSDERAWFRNDPGIRGFAEGEFVRARQANPDGSASEHLAEVERRAREKFPEAFGVTEQRRPPRVEQPRGSINGDGGDRPKSVDDRFNALPDDAKKAYERFAKSAKLANPSKPYTKEEYLSVYESQ